MVSILLYLLSVPIMNRDEDFLNFKINRESPTVRMKVGDLKFDNTYEIDPILSDKHKKFAQGKSKLFVTRLSIDRITPGFYKPTKKGLIYIYNRPETKDIEIVKTVIKQGHRPPLYLYPSIKPEDNSFLCSDDLLTYNAYFELGITKPPVAIYASKKGIEESCYIVKGGIDKEGLYNFVDGFHYHTYKELPLAWKEKGEMSPKEFFLSSASALKQAKFRLNSFHLEGAIHYHHTIYSIIDRVSTSLNSIEMLFKNANYLCAASIVRTMYEVLLNFYIDWLSPDIMYMYLQLSSVSKTKERMDAYNLGSESSIKRGYGKCRANKIKDSHQRCDQLASKVSEKAKMYPIDDRLHSKLYSSLSKIAHHSFSVNGFSFMELSNGSNSSYQELIIEILGVSDFVVKQVTNMVNGDTGFSVDV